MEAKMTEAEMMAGLKLPNPTTADVKKHLRWVLHNGERVLQQLWSVKTFDAETIACIGVHGEWRDVPVELDHAFRVNTRKRKNPPDIEG